MSQELLIQGLRSWIASALTLPDPNAQVIAPGRGQVGPSPSAPYLMVEVERFNALIGQPERLLTPLLTATSAPYEALVRLTGYGETAANWLSLLSLLSSGAPVSIAEDQGVVDVSALTTGTRIESRYVLDWIVQYRLTVNQAPGVPAQILEFQGAFPPDLPFLATSTP